MMLWRMSNTTANGGMNKMVGLQRAMLLARTSRQLPAVMPAEPAPPPAPVLTETEVTNRILIERVKHLEAAMALVLNELGIKVEKRKSSPRFASALWLRLSILESAYTISSAIRTRPSILT